MITVEDLLMAFASAYDVWLDPDVERKNPVPEYAALIRQAVNYENDTLGRGTCGLHDCEGSFAAVNRPVWRCDCGAFVTQYTDATTYHKPRYCPNCGARVVERTRGDA